MAQTASSVPPPTRAYNMEMRHAEADRARPDCQGWVFGLPPGIRSEQWPLDPNTGYPMVHGFTLRLPDDYRCHGPEIVAFSFFATPADQNDGGATIASKRLAGAILGKEPLTDPDIRALWDAEQAHHPRMHRMKDILDYHYAIILLTEAEFAGALCQPAPRGATLHVSHSHPPAWLDQGAGRAYFDFNLVPSPEKPLEEQPSYKLFGEMPARRLDWNRAIRWTPRAEDPNAGKAPEDPHLSKPPSSGYQQPFTWEGDPANGGIYRQQPWSEDHKPDHIGGTMHPQQWTPAMSPYYIEFEEYFGGYNFAGGNAQLDFLDMTFDWAH